MFYDANDIQLSTECNEVMNEDTAAKYKAWGWNVLTCNGNDVNEIRQALDAAHTEKSVQHLLLVKLLWLKVHLWPMEQVMNIV